MGGTKRKGRTPRELLTPAALHMLLALARKDLHGYGIKRDVEVRTGGRLRLGAGTLYEAISRMEADGWIRKCPGEHGNRKLYGLTERGRRVMEDELARLADVVDFAREQALLPTDGRATPKLASDGTG
jgi:DNA-binding PadR family transcriptional regulator